MATVPPLHPFVEEMIKLQNSAEQAASHYAKLANRIELTVLALSVLTSGAVWALAADALPKPLGWAGAVISTVVTFLTFYMYSSGIQQKRKRAIVVYEDITEYLGELRGKPYPEPNEFWVRYKAFERSLSKLKLEKPD